MGTSYTLTSLIDEASSIAGNQAQLAKLLGIPRSHITDMKKGTRPANWKVRGGMLAIVTGDPARAFMTAMAEDLEQSEKTDEKKAAESFKAILAAFPVVGGNGCIRTLNLALYAVFSGLRNAVNGTLRHGLGYAIFKRQPTIGMQAALVV